MEELVRLQKWLAQLGLYSRREAEKMIAEGRFTINGKVAELGSKVNPSEDTVCLDRVLVKAEQPSKVYWMLNKPLLHLVSRTSQEGKPTIYDLPALRHVPMLVHSVGRLDYKTEGLLLLTNDGELSKRLSHPRYKLPRQYSVLINGKLTTEQERKLAKGFKLKDGPVKCQLSYVYGQNLGKSAGSWYMITVYEGRNRLVRRIFEAMDFKVLRLTRMAFGNLTLPNTLKPGTYRQLTPDEIAYLKSAVELK
jgi:23S rRNA pseudouridine2605 synthase